MCTLQHSLGRLARVAAASMCMQHPALLANEASALCCLRRELSFLHAGQWHLHSTLAHQQAGAVSSADVGTGGWLCRVHTTGSQLANGSMTSSCSSSLLWSHTSSTSRQFTSSSSWCSSNDSSSQEDSGSAATSSARGKDMAIVFTCAKCDTRAVKAFSKQSFDKGVVLIRCPGCKSLHLIADHLGWFGDESFKIDEYLSAQGQSVKRVSLDVSNQPEAEGEGQQQLTAEDLTGWSKVQQLLRTVAGASQGAAEHADNNTAQGSSGSNASEPGSPSNGSTQTCGSTATAAAAAAGNTGGSGESSGGVAELDLGVVAVTPEDVKGWLQVQQQQQQQPDGTQG